MGKKLLKMLSVAMVIASSTMIFAGCGSSAQTSNETKKSNDEKVVNIFTWANYVPDDVVKKFQEKTGIKVNYSNFSTNEEMLGKAPGNKGFTI